MKHVLTVLAATLVLATPASAQAPPECPWMDTSKSATARANALLAASSLDQKLRWLDEQSANNPAQTVFNIGGGQTTTMPPQVPCTPVIQYTDAPSAITGAGTGITAFPVQVSLSATWDEALARRKGKAQGYEAFNKHRNVLLGPGLASGRTPLSGRTPEYLGEDPLLAGTLAAAMIHGLRDNPEAPVESVLKHYVANEQELDRQSSSSNVDQRALRQIYTLPYEVAIRKGRPGGVMCPFNQVNGEWGCENANILRQILKEEIGFDGWVVTDFGSRHSQTGVPTSLPAGMDQELNRWRFWNPDLLKAALAGGTITQAQIDEAAFRVVRAHIREGLFDHPLPAAPAPVVTSPEHQAIAREVAEKGAVLLKNDRALPLTAKAKRIAVIGPTASGTPTNGVSSASVCGTTRPNVPCTPIAPLDAITARAGGTVTFNDGSDPAAAAAAAAAADVAIVFGYYTSGEFEDPADIALDGNGDALIAAVSAAQRNTVVVLQTGGPVTMPWLSSVKAVLEVWYAGEQMGPAIAALLWGDVNPSGRLTHSFPRSEADLPTAGSPRQYPGVFSDGSTTRPPGSTEIRQVDYLEGLKVGYRWYDAERIRPLFPFGHGLSYTRFDYGKLDVDRHLVRAGKSIRASFRVKNTGSRTGTEVAQVYLSLPSYTGEPPKRLVGWERITLAPGRSKTVSVEIDPDEPDHPFSYWSPRFERWRIPSGFFKVSVGRSAGDLEDSEGVLVYR